VRNEILDVYVLSIDRLKAIDKEELMKLYSKKLTRRDLCLMIVDELERMSVRKKELNELPSQLKIICLELEIIRLL